MGLKFFNRHTELYTKLKGVNLNYSKNKERDLFFLPT